MWKKGKPVLATILMIACMAVVAADLFSVRAVADNGNLIRPQYANPYLSAEGNLLYVDVAEKVWNVIEARITFDEGKGTAQAREHDAFRKAVEDQKMIYNFAYNDTTPGLIRIAGAFAGHDTDDPLEYSGHVLVIRFEESQLPVEVTMNGQTVVVGGEASVPSEAPTGAPTEEPTEAPTEGPTGEPVQGPTEEPTGEPTQGPTEEPTGDPTDTPTETPTGEPIQGPTEGPSETPTEMPDSDVVYGDLDENGEINTSDALMILKIVVKLETPTETQRQAADVDNSGAVDTADALAVLKKVVKLIERFPAEEAEPSEQPGSTEEPTGEPTEGPTEEPTGEPTEVPEEGPTGEPTEGSTEKPSGFPTEEPTEEPAGEPTEVPEEGPTGEPIEGPAEGGQL